MKTNETKLPDKLDTSLAMPHIVLSSDQKVLFTTRSPELAAEIKRRWNDFPALAEHEKMFDEVVLDLRTQVDTLEKQVHQPILNMTKPIQITAEAREVARKVVSFYSNSHPNEQELDVETVQLYANQVAAKARHDALTEAANVGFKLVQSNPENYSDEFETAALIIKLAIIKLDKKKKD